MKLFTLILFLAFFLLGCNGDVSSLISSSLFESMLKHRNDQGCSNGFYTYNVHNCWEKLMLLMSQQVYMSTVGKNMCQ